MYGAKPAKQQPRKREACDGCVGSLIELKAPEALIEEAAQDKRTHGTGPDQVLLINYLLPGHGTQQTTLCTLCRKDILGI